VADASAFRSGHEFATWLGLVPRHRREVPTGRHNEAGNRYLRRLLINGASANLLRCKVSNNPWVIGLRRRRPPLVAVALANKTARIARQ
jgi:transposase